MHSSDSHARIEFSKVFYKQLFHNLFAEMHNNALETRFYKFQISFFRQYFDNLNANGMKKALSFISFADEEKTQILESVFYHLAQALGTFPMEFLGEEVDLSKEIETDDFQLMQNSLMGARPRAVDRYSIEFLEEQHKKFCEHCYFNFLIFIIKQNVAQVNRDLHSELIVKSVVAQMSQFDQALQCKQALNIAVNLADINNYKDFKRLFCEVLNEIDPQSYNKTKGIIESWGLEAGIVELFTEIQTISGKKSINVGDEWIAFIETNLLEICLKEFTRELNDNEQKFHVFIPTNLSHAENWETTAVFNFRFIKIDNIQNYIKPIPESITKEYFERWKEIYSHVIYTETHHRNQDFAYVKEIIHDNWRLFVNLVDLHETLPNAFKILLNNSVACSNPPDYQEKQTWYRSGISSPYNIPIDNSGFNKKMVYFNKYIAPLLSMNNDLAKRFITSLRHYRDSLEFQKDNPAFSFGSLWLCLEVLSCDFKPDKVAKKMSFAPAILTDEFYSKAAVQNLSVERAIEIYENRKKAYETIIESLGDLRNTLIFHKRENIPYQDWRLKKHIELLRRIVIKSQIVVASELSRDNSLNAADNVRRCMEERMRKEQ